MKSILLSIVFLFSSFFLFSQSIITNTNQYRRVGNVVFGGLMTYQTHFTQVDSSKVTYTSISDTIQFWCTATQPKDDEFVYVSNYQFTQEGIYYLTVENSIDGVMTYSQPINVVSANYQIQNVQVISDWRFKTDTTVVVQIKKTSNSPIPVTFNSAYFIPPTRDTLFVDSVSIDSNYPNQMKLYFNIPFDADPAYYDLYVIDSAGSLLTELNSIFIYNNGQTQIDSVSPDSLNNLSPYSTEITIYGNHTHFLADTNVILPIWGTEFDSVRVVNDSLLKCYIAFPIPVKQAISPNSILSLYNATDHLLEYPIRVDMYSAIGDNKESYKSIVCYPNPANKYLNIYSEELMDAKDLSISIYSISGLKVYGKQVENQSNIRFDIHNLASGMYLIYIQDSKRKQVIKFIKQ
jgi:hypothetical protein